MALQTSAVLRSLSKLQRPGRTRWVALLGTLVLTLAAAPISQMDSHHGRYLLAGVACILLLSAWSCGLFDSHTGLGAGTPGLRRQHWITLWLCLGLLGLGNYYQFDEDKSLEVDNYGDVTYYYLNSKYFEELGYTNLYRAMLVADQQEDGALRKVRRYRDLVAYEDFYPRKKALREKKEVQALFSQDRWQAFRTDLKQILQRHKRGWRYFFSDHGYNPPPPWTLVGGQLSSWVSVPSMKWITAVDMLLMAAAFIGIALAWSIEVSAIALVFFCVTFSGRWPLLGQALLRFDWLATVILAAVFLKTKRPAWAGACLMYATAVRIFPAVFALPCLAVFARDSWQAKRPTKELTHFALGAAACGLVLIGGALWRYGPEAFIASYKNLALHGSPESLSSHRVGLGDALLYRGEWSDGDLDRSGGIGRKREQLWALLPYLKVLGALSVVAIVTRVVRSSAPASRVLWLGIYPLFILTTPQINYYNLRLLLVIFHVPRLHDVRHRLGLTLLFLIEVVAQGTMTQGGIRYAVTTLTSWGLLIYLVGMAVLFWKPARAWGPAQSQHSEPDPPSPPKQESSPARGAPL